MASLKQTYQHRVRLGTLWAFAAIIVVASLFVAMSPVERLGADITPGAVAASLGAVGLWATRRFRLLPFEADTEYTDWRRVEAFGRLIGQM